MTKEDFEQFSELWCAAWELCGKYLTERAVLAAYDALCGYALMDIQRALMSHIRDPDAGRFQPKPADVIGRILAGAQDGRPGPEEAWSMCPMSERETAWMTHEMSVAQAAAFPLIDRGDLIAARKTFLEVYERAVKEQRITKKLSSWQKSLGWDQWLWDSPFNENMACKYLEQQNHKPATEQLPDCGIRLSDLLSPVIDRKRIQPPAMNDRKACRALGNTAQTE